LHSGKENAKKKDHQSGTKHEMKKEKRKKKKN